MLSVYFSPDGGGQKAILDVLALARREVLVLAYSFTAKEIIDALIAANSRGVVMSVVLDVSNESEVTSGLKRLLAAGVSTLIDDKHAIAHNKVMIIDGSILIAGSYNYSESAERYNAENMQVITAMPDVIAKYRDNFLVHQNHSRTPKPKTISPVLKALTGIFSRRSEE